MLVPTIIMASIALILVFIGYRKGDGLHITGMQSAWTMTIQVLPLLIFAFVAAGMIQALLPQDLLNKWVGAESGFRGIMIGTIAGGLTPDPKDSLRGRSICQFTNHCRFTEIRRRRWNNGRFSDQLVTLGGGSPAHGVRHSRLEIHPHPAGIDFLLPSYRRFYCTDVFR